MQIRPARAANALDTQTRRQAYDCLSCLLTSSRLHATPRHATPRHATPRHATPRHATPRIAPLRRVTAVLFATTAPTLQQAVNDIATMHIGDAPPKSRLGAGAGASMEAHAQMLLPKKLQQQMRLQLAKIDTAKLMGELHGYKQPPEDVHKVVRGVLVLMGHGRSTGQDTSTWELCRPHLTFQLIKDMQTFDVVVVSSKHHTEERWKESLQATDGVDAEQVFQKFPHGVKVMMQWLEAARLVHRMAHQVKAQEEKRKRHIREVAAAAIQVSDAHPSLLLLTSPPHASPPISSSPRLASPARPHLPATYEAPPVHPSHPSRSR